jgi:hypothetical protein
VHEVSEIDFDMAKKIPDILINPILNKKCAILDGSGFGHHLYEVLLVPGKIDFILNFNQIYKRGTELNAARRLLMETTDGFGAGFFDLILGDGLYYTKNHFELCIETLRSHLLVKTSEKLNIVKDVEFYIENNAPEVVAVKGFDSERMCEYTKERVLNATAKGIEE